MSPLSIGVIYLWFEVCPGWMTVARGTLKCSMNSCWRLGCSGPDPDWCCIDDLDGPGVGEGESQYGGGESCGIVLVPLGVIGGRGTVVIRRGWVQGPVDGETEV